MTDAIFSWLEFACTYAAVLVLAWLLMACVVMVAI